jgi:hypothetical protein
LGDALAASGAVLTIMMAVAAGFGLLPMGAPFLGVGLLIVGYALSTKVQRQSTKERSLALKEAPLVYAVLVDPPASLRESGRGVARCAAVFSTDTSDRFEARGLAGLAERIAGDRGASAKSMASLVSDTFQPGCHPVPEVYDPPPNSFAANVVVYQDRLEDQVLPADVPRIPVIVDTEQGFIEHV